MPGRTMITNRLASLLAATYALASLYLFYKLRYVLFAAVLTSPIGMAAMASLLILSGIGLACILSWKKSPRAWKLVVFIFAFLAVSMLAIGAAINDIDSA